MTLPTLSHLTTALLLAASATFALPAQAEAPALQVSYHSWSVGQDGVRREMSYGEKIYRDADQIWIARDIPEAAQQDHGGHAHDGLGHKHTDLTGAPLWIRRAADGSLDVQWVDALEQRLIEVSPPYYGNVGFSGSWEEARSLVEPSILTRLGEPRRDADGLLHYRAEQTHQVVTVVWDEAGDYAREITAQRHDGLGGRVIRAEPITAPQPPAWAAVQNYLPRDYSDILD